MNLLIIPSRFTLNVDFQKSQRIFTNMVNIVVLLTILLPCTERRQLKKLGVIKRIFSQKTITYG